MPDRVADLKDKPAILRRMIEDEYLLVHIDPSAEMVEIPAHLLKNPTVTLKLSRLFRGGLELKNDLIETTLLFDQKYVDCRIPLSAVWGVTGADGSNVVWPLSAPQGLFESLIIPGETAAETSSAAGDSDRSRQKGKLRRIK